MAFDENGRMYVAEMRTYPDEAPVAGGPPGRIRLLDDADGDGRFEKASIFADNVHWPSGVACSQGGVYVVAPPDILYMKDTDGDGIADIRRVEFTGLGTILSENMANNLKWGPDQWIYGAGSYNGGEVRPADDAGAEPISIRGRDFRFDPDSKKFEAIEGTGGDFGNCFDDWGNRFTSNSVRPVIYATIPSRYLEKNPYLRGVRAANGEMFRTEGRPRVFPISGPEPWKVIRQRFWSRWVDTNHEMRAARFPPSELASQGYMTGVAGSAIYRGAAYPESFRGNVLSSEPSVTLLSA